MEFISDESSFSANQREEDEGRHVGGNWVLWLAAIAVLVGLNFASWSFCMWVFGQPEHPMNYQLLTRLEKLDPIQGFTPVTAPRGKFYSTKDLYAEVYPFNGTELRAYNGILKRHYLRNYLEREGVPYLKGDFTVVSCRKLTEKDVFPKGIAVRAISTTFPDGFADLVLPTAVDTDVLYQPGEPLVIEESTTCAAVLHVDRDENDVMIFTVVPLVARQYTISGDKTIELEPPGKVNLGSGKWPISGGDIPSGIATEFEPVVPAQETESEGEKEEGDGT